MKTNDYLTSNPTISFGQAVKNFYSKYFDFKSRARRSEFWWAQLYIVIVINVFLNAILFIPEVSEFFDTVIIICILLSILFLIPIPWLSLTIRRLHDIGKSGWYILLFLIPIIGVIIVLVFCLMDSTKGKNDWGVSPKYSVLDTSPDRISKKFNTWSYIWPFLLLIVSLFITIMLFLEDKRSNDDLVFYLKPQLVIDADRIYDEFMYNQDPIDVARDSTYVKLKRYINSKIGTDFNISELDFSFVRYSLSFGEIDDAIFKVDDSRFEHELYVIGTVDARRVILDERRKYRLSGTFQEEDVFNISAPSVGVVGRGGCLSFGLLRFGPLEVYENDNYPDDEKYSGRIAVDGGDIRDLELRRIRRCDGS